MSETRKHSVLNRILVSAALLLAWSTVIVFRLIYLQIFRHDDLLAKAERQQSLTVEVNPLRGQILDRKMRELAASVDVESVYASPRDLASPERAAAQLSEVLGLDQGGVLPKLRGSSSFVWIKRKVTPREKEAVAVLRLQGVNFLKESQRFYPHRELAAHVLGFVGLDNGGLSGLEYFYDAQVRGTPGRILLNRDARKTPMEGQVQRPATAGNVLVLSIDQNLQYHVEQMLAEAVAACQAASGTAILMDPHTGEILALANVPTYNPNDYSSSGKEAWRNQAISDTYEPGSTFKIITAAASLEEGLARADEQIDCQQGRIVVAGHSISDHHPYGWLTFKQVLEHSSNVGAIKLGLRLGNERLHAYVRKFGFGQRTGIDLPGEEPGLVWGLSSWTPLSVASISMGHEIGVTALQLLVAISSVANGGYWVQPHLVNRMISPEGDLLWQWQPVRKKILGASATRVLLESLEGAVLRGTGREAALEGYRAAGKTGTAQKIVDGVYSHTKFVASFAGFAPVQDARIAAIVVMNEPQGSRYYGGEVAAPVFKKIVEPLLVKMGLPPEEPAVNSGVESEPADVRVPDVNDYAPARTMTEVLPASDEPNQIVLSASMGNVEVPDFRGKSLRAVIRECAGRGLRLRPAGSGIAVEQIPPPGASVYADSQVMVWFSSPTSGNTHEVETP